MAEKIEALSQAAFWGFWLQVTKWAAKILASVLIVRMLGKEQYGFLSVIKIFVSYVMVFYTLSLEQAILRYLPEIRVLGIKGGAIRFLGKIISFQTVLWSFFLVTIFFLSAPLSTRLGGGIQEYLWVAVALSFFSLLQLDLTNALTTFYKVKTQVLSGALAALILLGLFYGVLCHGLGIWGVLFSEALVAAGLSFWFLKELRGTFRATKTSEEKTLPISFSRILRFSFPYVCLTLLNQIIWRQSEVFFLAHYETPSVVGVYNVGFTLPQLALEFIPSMLGSIGIVGAVEQFIKGVDHLSKGITLYYKFLFFLLAPVIVGGALFSDRLVYFLYGPGFHLSGVLARIYFVIFSSIFFLVPYGLANVAEEKIWVAVALSAPFCVLNLLLDFFLIKQFGIWGAVWAVGITQITGFVATLFCWKRVFPYVVIPWRFIGKCFLAAAPFLLFLPIKILSDHLLWFILICLMMGGLYLWAVRGMRLFGPEEMALFAETRFPFKQQIIGFLKG